MVSPLEQSILFLQEFGFFSVVLPFLLVFTLIFAILEKTKILGTEEIEGKPIPKRNLNAMFAFVVALFVVATPTIVKAIEVSLPQVSLFLLVIICFMLLAGSFMGSKEFTFEQNKFWKIFLTAVAFFGVILIFLSAIKLPGGESWLSWMWGWVLLEWGGTVFASITLLIIVIGAILFIVTGGPKKEKKG